MSTNYAINKIIDYYNLNLISLLENAKYIIYIFFFTSISLVYYRDSTAYISIYTYLTLRDPVLPFDAIYLRKYSY
jgi:hypothetical protein